MAFDLTNLTGNETSLVQFMQVTNNASQGVLFAGFIMGLFIIQTSAMVFKTNTPVIHAGTISAWLCFWYALFFSMAGLLNFFFVIGFLTVAAFGTLFMYLEGK